MFGINRLSADDRLARDVFRAKESAIDKLGNSPDEDMTKHLRKMFVNEYRRYNWDAEFKLPDSLVEAAFNDAYRVTEKGDAASSIPYGDRLRKAFLGNMACYVDGEFGCW